MQGSAVWALSGLQQGLNGLPTAPDKIPGNIEFAAKELFEARGRQCCKAFPRRSPGACCRIILALVSGEVSHECRNSPDFDDDLDDSPQKWAPGRVRSRRPRGTTPAVGTAAATTTPPVRPPPIEVGRNEQRGAVTGQDQMLDYAALRAVREKLTGMLFSAHLEPQWNPSGSPENLTTA